MRLAKIPLSTLLAIFLLASAVRIIGVTRWPVWTDEGWSAWVTEDPRIDVVLDKVAHDRHPPLYFLSLTAWSGAAGHSLLALRFLSIAAGLLTVAVGFRLAADWFGPTVATYTALLLAMLDSVVYYTQEIRHYSWLILAAGLAMLLFLRYLRRSRRSLLIATMLSAASLPYLEYTGALVVAGQVLIGLLAWRGSARQKLGLVVAWIGAAILYIPWLRLALLQFGSLSTGVPSNTTTLPGLLDLGSTLFNPYLLALMIGLIALGAWQIAARPSVSLRWLAQMTMALTGIAGLGALIIVNLRVSVLLPRTVIFLMPFLLIVCACGLSLLSVNARRLLMGTILVFSLFAAPIIQPRQDSDVLAAAVKADYSPGDLVLVEAGWDDYAFYTELRLALGDQARIQLAIPWYEYSARTLLQSARVDDSQPAMKASQRVWIVNWFATSSLIPYLDNGGDGFRRVLTRDIPVGAEYQGRYADNTMRAYLYERPTTGGAALNFGNILSLQNVVAPTYAVHGQPIHVDLWWSALQTPSRDYSVGVYLQDPAGVVQAQSDAPPAGQQTSTWHPGNLVFDRHTLTVPSNLPFGTYKLIVKVYWFGDQQPLAVSGPGSASNGEKYAIVGTITSPIATE